MEGENERPKRFVGGICIKEDQVLLIYRVNKERMSDQEYFLFPGRDAEEDESLEDVLHEEFKEMGMIVTVGELFLSHEDNDFDNLAYYYVCEYQLGEPYYVGKSDEMEAMKEGKQLYTPMWVPITELDNVIAYPEEVKEKVIQDLRYK